MPEGPSLVILKVAMQPFTGKKVLEVRGNAKIEMAKLQKQRIEAIRTWGKQIFICLPQTTIRIHFLMFGSYSIDEQTRPDKSLRLYLRVAKHRIYFYTCAVRLIDDNLDQLYDWEADVMSDKWNPAKARKKLKSIPATMVCDALLDQQVFSGVGNIIKNEVLYRIKLHPETLIGNVPPRKLTELINEARNYSFDFLEWKKDFVLKKHWQAHTKKTCARCSLPLLKKYCGKTKRRTFYCENCQVKYS
jgi:endonuclease-8